MLSRVETAVIYIHPLPYPPRFFHVLPGMPKQQCAFFFWYRVKGEKKKTLTKTIRTLSEMETRTMYTNRKT